MTKISLVILLLVFATGVLAYLAWKDWAAARVEGDLRKKLMLAALISLSIGTLLFVGYVGHNAIMGGDRSGNAMSLLCIRSGNYLSAVAVLLSLGGKGRGKWLTFLGGCIMLFLWLGQGMSL